MLFRYENRKYRTKLNCLSEKYILSHQRKIVCFKMLSLFVVPFISGCCWHADSYMKYIAEQDFLDGFRDVIPSGWTYEYVSYCNHEAYKFSPYFVIDFMNYNIECNHMVKSKKCEADEIYLTYRLEFYNKQFDQNIVEVIAKSRNEKINMPHYFDETKDYVILISGNSVYLGRSPLSERQYEAFESSLKIYCDTLK